MLYLFCIPETITLLLDALIMLRHTEYWWNNSGVGVGFVFDPSIHPSGVCTDTMGCLLSHPSLLENDGKVVYLGTMMWGDPILTSFCEVLTCSRIVNSFQERSQWPFLKRMKYFKYGVVKSCGSIPKEVWAQGKCRNKYNTCSYERKTLWEISNTVKWKTRLN